MDFYISLKNMDKNIAGNKSENGKVQPETS